MSTLRFPEKLHCFASVLLCAASLGCGGASESTDPVDLRGVYELTISHDAASQGARHVADRLAAVLSGSNYLKVTRRNTSVEIGPGVDAEIMVYLSLRSGQRAPYTLAEHRRRWMNCGLSDTTCRRRYPSQNYGIGDLWGTLHLRIRRKNQEPETRTLVDHVHRGSRWDLYDLLAHRASELL